MELNSSETENEESDSNKPKQTSEIPAAVHETPVRRSGVPHSHTHRVSLSETTHQCRCINKVMKTECVKRK